MPAIRLATPADCPAMAAIYAPYVENTTISFEYTPPSSEEFQTRLTATLPGFPWLVCEQAGKILGYAYAHRMGERAGFNWSCETSVYVDQNSREGGVGRLLYTELEAILQKQGYRNMYALIASPNPPSERFHERMGFTLEGHLTQVGVKFGKPVGVLYYTKPLLPAAENPPLPVAFSELNK